MHVNTQSSTPDRHEKERLVVMQWKQINWRFVLRRGPPRRRCWYTFWNKRGPGSNACHPRGFRGWSKRWLVPPHRAGGRGVLSGERNPFAHYEQQFLNNSAAIGSAEFKLRVPSHSQFYLLGIMASTSLELWHRPSHRFLGSSSSLQDKDESSFSTHLQQPSEDIYRGFFVRDGCGADHQSSDRGNFLHVSHDHTRHEGPCFLRNFREPSQVSSP